MWGDIPAWAAFALALAAALGGWRTRRKQDQANAGVASAQQSLQRIADNLDPERLARARDGEAAALPEFNVEFLTGSSYRLRNVSAVPATKIRTTVESYEHRSPITRNLPNDIDLAPLQSSPRFLLISSWQVPAPGELIVECAELPTPVRVPIPPSH
jgi:hypothetical protein